VDLVNPRGMLAGVLHEKARVLVIQHGAPTIEGGINDPAHPPQAVCVLEGPRQGITGFVASDNLQPRACD
jgi:hypothetical protein